jgi:hypothetical protein
VSHIGFNGTNEQWIGLGLDVGKYPGNGGHFDRVANTT